MSAHPPTYFGFRDYLWDALPQARQHILDEELGEAQRRPADPHGPGTYRFMSTAFRHVLEEAARGGDLALARRCIALIEQMLVGGDDTLADAVQIRVLDKDGLVAELPDLYRAYAGPLTRRRLDYPDADPADPAPAWRPPAPVADGRPGAAAQAVRSWWWERTPAIRSFLLAAERDEVRATMSLAAMTPDRYFTGAVLHGMLPDAEEYVLGNGDLEPTGQAADALELMLADPAVAALAGPHAGEVAAAVDRNLALRFYAGPRLCGLLDGQ